MRVLQRDMKHGRVRLVVETADDLWYLHTLLDPGDRCTGDSEYKEKRAGDDARAKVVKRKVWVAIAVEKTALEHGGLRIAGTVVDGSEEVPRGSHHALDIAPGGELEIEKGRWLDYHIEKLDEAARGGHLRTLLVLFDRQEALFALLRPSGHETLLALKGEVPKKGFDEGKTKSFYAEIVHHLAAYDARLGTHRIIAASPSFWKEYLHKALPPELQAKVIFAAVSDVDESAIGELLRRPELQQALEGERASREAALLDAFMLALAKDKLAYGIADVERIVEEGNVREIGVTESHIGKAREDGTYARLDAVLKTAADRGARVHLFSTRESARQLDGLGGIAGVKRW